MDEGCRADCTIEKRLLKLGKRDSAICARLYDKGLEQRVAGPGVWERLEVEFKDDRAPQAALALVNAKRDWPKLLRNLIAGSMDFRIANGRSEFARRPQAAWWSRLMRDAAPRRLPPLEDDSSWEQWLAAFRFSYGRRLVQMAELTLTQLGPLVESLCEGLLPADNSTRALRQFMKAAAIHAHPDSDAPLL